MPTQMIIRIDDEVKSKDSISYKRLSRLPAARKNEGCSLYVKTIPKDPADDKFIECAVALKANIVVSEDKAMLAVKEYMGIKLLSPRLFLDLYGGV